MIFPLLGSSIKLIVDESLAGCGWRYHAAEGGLDVEGEVLHPRGVVLPCHVRVHLLVGMKQWRCAQLQKMPQNYFSSSLGDFHANSMIMVKIEAAWRVSVWCGVAQLVARRLAVRQPEFDSRLGTTGRCFPTEQTSDEEMERGLSKWRWLNVLYECD
jgi:hypothetical protein